MLEHFHIGQHVLVDRDPRLVMGDYAPIDLIAIFQFGVIGTVQAVNNLDVSVTWERYGTYTVSRRGMLRDAEREYREAQGQDSLHFYADAPAGIDAPKKAGDAGYDLHADRDGEIFYGSWRTFETAAVEIPEGYCGLVIGRSSLNTRGILCVFGLIDSGYRGKIKVMLYTIDPNRSWTNPLRIQAGERIAQLVLVPVLTLPLMRLDRLTDLSVTERNSDGFGSTGR